MSVFGSSLARAAASLAAFSFLWTGVMADELDSSLIGVISAAIVVVLLLITVIVFLAYCCYRRMEGERKSPDRNSVLARKDSGSVSTNAGIAPRWAPVYSMPTEPVLYAMPPSQYYLGHYSPKFIDAEGLEYMRHQYVDAGQEEVVGMPPDLHHVMRHSAETRAEHVMMSERQEEVARQQEVTRGRHEVRQEVTQERQEMTQERQEVVVLQGETITAAEVVQQQVEETPPSPQSNEFAASSENYRVIRKQHKHEKMPEWLRKSYGENEQSMDMGEESSTSGDFSGDELVLPPMPEQVVRAEVSPHNSFLDSGEVLKVPPSFTIVDYVDPETRMTTGQSSYVLPAKATGAEGDYTEETNITRRVIITDDVSSTSGGPLTEVSLNAGVNATADVNTTSHVTATSDVTTNGGSKATTTRVVTTYTTLYSAEGAVVEGMSVGDAVGGASFSSYPASTSTPRLDVLPPPPPPPPPSLPLIEVLGAEDDLDQVDITAADSGESSLLHYRMRQPGNGSLSNLPEAVAAEAQRGT